MASTAEQVRRLARNLTDGPHVLTMTSTGAKRGALPPAARAAAVRDAPGSGRATQTRKA